MSYGRGHNLIRKLLQYFNIDFDKLPKRYKYLVIIGLIGIMLMLVSSIFSNKQNDSIIEEQKPPLPVNENDLEDHEQIDKEEEIGRASCREREERRKGDVEMNE